MIQIYITLMEMTILVSDKGEGNILYVICNYVFINSNYYTISILNNMYSRR